jgi:hypothetical protein
MTRPANPERTARNGELRQCQTKAESDLDGPPSEANYGPIVSKKRQVGPWTESVHGRGESLSLGAERPQRMCLKHGKNCEFSPTVRFVL